MEIGDGFHGQWVACLHLMSICQHGLRPSQALECKTFQNHTVMAIESVVVSLDQDLVAPLCEFVFWLGLDCHNRVLGISPLRLP